MPKIIRRMMLSSTASTNNNLIVVVATTVLLLGIGVVSAFTTSTSTTITRTTRNINIIPSFQEIQSQERRRRQNNHYHHRLYHRSTIHEEDIDKEEECDDDDTSIDIDDSSPSSSSPSPSPASLFWPSSQKKTTYNKHAAAATAAATAVADEVVVDQNQHPIDHYDQIFDSIVKIYSTHNKHPDMMMPWQKLGSYTSTSSGFIIQNNNSRCIITNAHSIEYAGQVLVRKRGSNSKKYLATIEVVANECDLAMLTIEDDSFWYNDDDEEYDEEYDDAELDDDEELDDGDGDEYDEDDNNNNNGIESTTQDNNDEEDDEYGYEFDDEYNAVKMKTMNMIKPLEFGLLPELQDEVEVIGYPTGGDSLSITKGVVSRIESTEYVQCSGSHLLAIQIDAAINGGNSGGPVICSITQKVIGVAFQSLNDAENIGYVIPVTVVLHFLENIQRSNNKNSHHYSYSGVTCLGVRFGKLENSAMRSYLKLPKEKQDNTNNQERRRRRKKCKTRSISSSSSLPSYSGLGILIRSCDPITPSKQYLKPNDVILYVDDIPVSSDGNIPFRRNGRERVSFSSYIQTKFVTTSTTRDTDTYSSESSDTVKLDIWRDGKLFKDNPIQVPVCISKNLIPSHWNNYSPPYLLVGGLVFTVLSVPYLEEMNAWGDYISDNISYLLTKVNEPLQQENDQIVILVNILPHPTTLGYDSNINNLHLTSLNNQKVRSLQHLQELIRTTSTTATPIATTIAGTNTEAAVVGDSDKKAEFLKFEFGGGGSDDNDQDECSGDGDGGGGTLIVLETNALDEITREVCEEHSIQKSYYFPPTLQSQSQLQSQQTKSTTTSSSGAVASSEIITTTTTTTTTIAPNSAETAAVDDDDDDDNNDANDVTVATTTTTTATAAAADNNSNNNYSWEEELLKKSKPLIPAPPSISECFHVLKQDGVVRLNPSKFFVNKDLCTKLRNQILNEMNNKPPPLSTAAAATVNNGSNNDNNKMKKKKKKERYVPGTRLRFDSSMDLTFGGDVRHDMLLPIDFKDDYDTNFPELQVVLESAASELEPLLLEAVKDMLPRLYGSSIRGNAINGNVVDNDESILESGTSSAEVVEVGSLIVRNGSGHQSVHGDYRRFRDGDGDENNEMKEESIQNTNLRIGKMPPRIVVFVALQDIPSNEYGSTGFITGTHNSQAHGLIYGRDGIDNNGDNSIDDDLRKKARRDLILDNVSTNGVRTTAGFKCGEMLIYDASVLHWGLKNSVVDNDRCMLYFGVARSGSPALLDQDQPLPPDQFEVISPVLLQDITGANTKSSKKS